MNSCPNCGSANKRLVDLMGRCSNVPGCEARRCLRRRAQDRELWRNKRWVQCLSTIGKRSLRFCTLGEGHEGRHLSIGATEWG